MKKFTALSFLFILAVTLNAQVVLQNFSSVLSANTYFYGTWEATGQPGTNTPNASFTQGSGVYNILGSATDNSNSYVEFFNTTPASISGYNFISVTFETLNTNASSSFAVTLVDTGGKSAYAAFPLGSYTGSYNTLVSAITAQSGFNWTSIDSFQISGNQPTGTSVFNVSFDQVVVTAVPEPATYAALAGLLALGLVAYRRRRAA